MSIGTSNWGWSTLFQLGRSNKKPVLLQPLGGYLMFYLSYSQTCSLITTDNNKPFLPARVYPSFPATLRAPSTAKLCPSLSGGQGIECFASLHTLSTDPENSLAVSAMHDSQHYVVDVILFIFCLTESAISTETTVHQILFSMSNLGLGLCVTHSTLKVESKHCCW